MNFGILASFLILCLTCNSEVKSYRILGVFTTPMRSHLQTHMAIVKGLVDRGHNVTLVTSLPVTPPEKISRYLQLEVPEYQVKFLEAVKALQTKTHFFSVLNTFKFLVDHSVACMRHEAMENLLKSEDNFDLVIVGYVINEIEFGIGAHFNCPVVVVWVNQLLSSVSKLVGNPLELSYVPTLLTNGLQPMGFFQRVKNHIYTLLDIITNSFIYYYSSGYYSVQFPQELYPSFDEVRRNVSLVLFNHHFSQQLISPLVPAAVEIGGIQIKEKQDPLPENIQKFLDDATPNGAIYFSFGTSVRSSELGRKAEDMYCVLSSLPQKVIWKWESDQKPGNSSNILFSKWLPQDDILAHPNTRLFITHGGLGSITEARYHAVPVVAIPFFGDQYGNVETVRQAGWGRIVDFETLDEHCFRDAINDVLENPKYREQIKKLSQIFRDRPMSPLQTAMYWIEYVIRHRGAGHMQSPAVHMNTISYYSLDIFAFILAILYVVYKISKVILSNFMKIFISLWIAKTKRD